MSLPADQRAHYLAITARVLADQVRGCNLPGEAGARISGLIEQIRENAQTLCDDLNPRHGGESVLSAPAPDIQRGGKIIPFQRRSG